MGGGRRFVTVSFLDSRFLTNEEYQNLEESEEDDDYDDLSFGAHSVPKNKLKYKHEKREVSVITREFVWTYPWVRCNLSVMDKGSLSWAIQKGYFTPIYYELDNSPGISAISFFLTSVEIAERNQLIAFLKSQPNPRLKDFFTLLKKWDNPRSIEIHNIVKKSPEGKILDLAIHQHNMFSYGPFLFRSQIFSLLGVDKNAPKDDASPSDIDKELSPNEILLKTLEDIISKEFWPIGFSSVLYGKTKFSGLEVPLRYLKCVPFFERLEPLHCGALCLYDAFKTLCYKNGHTYLSHQDVSQLSRSSETLDNVLSFMEKHGVITIEGKPRRYHLSGFWKAEEKIVQIFRELLYNPSWHIELADGLFNNLSPDREQEKAAKMIASNPITVISGKGGTGKTEIVTSVLSSIKREEKTLKDNENEDEKRDEEEDGNTEEESASNVLYVAPTGKAAAVIRSRIRSKAYTIHQILISHKKFISQKEIKIWKFSEVEVDEFSMVGMTLFSSLISILSESAQLKKVVLLGDVLQLPSISPGNLMEDIFSALLPHNLAIELITNHRSEGSLIFDNAVRISRNIMPIIDGSKGFHLIQPDWNDSVGEALALKRRCSSDTKNVSEGKINAYLKLLIHNRTEFNIDCQDKSQFIAFTRKECELLNQYSCKIYNGHYIHEFVDNKFVKSFVEGDKIMCTRNRDVPISIVKENVIVETKDERLMNGSVYVIRKLTSIPISDKGENSSTRLCYELDDLHGEVIFVEKEAFNKSCKPCHAWALTIHKFQGSETHVIVYGVSRSLNENWKHVYTAITRGKNRVIIVGSKSDLNAAINRHPKPRQTTLKNKIVNLLSFMPIKREDSCFSINDDSFDQFISQLEGETNSKESSTYEFSEDSIFDNINNDGSVKMDFNSNDSFDFMISQSHPSNFDYSSPLRIDSELSHKDEDEFI